MREKVNQLCMELLSIVRHTNLSDTAEQVLLDGKISSRERRRRRPASADQRETDEAERHTTGETCASQSDMPGDLPHRHSLHLAAHGHRPARCLTDQDMEAAGINTHIVPAPRTGGAGGALREHNRLDHAPRGVFAQTGRSALEVEQVEEVAEPVEAVARRRRRAAGLVVAAGRRRDVEACGSARRASAGPTAAR